MSSSLVALEELSGSLNSSNQFVKIGPKNTLAAGSKLLAVLDLHFGMEVRQAFQNIFNERNIAWSFNQLLWPPGSCWCWKSKLAIYFWIFLGWSPFALFGFSSSQKQRCWSRSGEDLQAPPRRGVMRVNGLQAGEHSRLLSVPPWTASWCISLYFPRFRGL